tara:strand:+ start:2484 stop:3005 length:522 start_codon:yes stop_codon:yes gene_type:complete
MANEMHQYMSMLSGETQREVGNFYGMGGYGQSYDPNNPYSGLRTSAGYGDDAGDDLYADLIRAQTRDYNQRFAPIENFMAGQITATGTKSLGDDLARTRSSSLGAVANVQGQQNRSMGRMGLSNTSNIANSTTAVGGLVGGLNDTRLRDTDRRNSILSGSMSGVSQKARSTGQ